MYTYEYIPFRGLIRKTLEFYDIKTKINEEGKPISVGFKYASGKYLVKSLENKDFFWSPSGGEPDLFGRNLFTAGGNESVIITEGAEDAATCYQVLGLPSVSVRSATTAARDCAHFRSWLNSHSRIYLGFDNDSVGAEARRAVARSFDYNKVYVLDWDRRKDANEYLQAGEPDEIRNIYANARRYLPETIVSSFDDFKKILRGDNKPSVPYPFDTLNKLTYGIRKGESVLITAQEGVGKTEIMHAIEHKLLTETDDGVASIFLEEPKRRHLQTLAGITLGCPAHLPDVGVTDDQVIAALEKSIKNNDKLYLYNHFGSNDPDTLLDTIRFLVGARSVGYVLLDHISMVVSGLTEQDERKVLDYLATKLEMMVKDLNFSLIFVSHVNDNGQTRGSRYLSKVADIRIDVHRDLASNSNIASLQVSKNRFSGITGPAGNYSFDTYRRTYVEVTDEQLADRGFLQPANDNVRGSGRGAPWVSAA